MNPFDDDNENETSNINILSSEVLVWVETNEKKGKKKNTCISGLPYDKKEQNEHLKELKKRHGCNGSIKEDDKKTLVIQLQGDHIYTVVSYLKSIGIKDIKIND